MFYLVSIKGKTKKGDKVSRKIKSPDPHVELKLKPGRYKVRYRIVWHAPDSRRDKLAKSKWSKWTRLRVKRNRRK